MGDPLAGGMRAVLDRPGRRRPRSSGKQRIAGFVRAAGEMLQFSFASHTLVCHDGVRLERITMLQQMIRDPCTLMRRGDGGLLRFEPCPYGAVLFFCSLSH
jgi:hypothetical protein